MEGSTAVYQKNHVVGAFLVGLVIGLGAYFVWDNQGNIADRGPKDTGQSEEGDPTDTIVMESKNSVSVSDQLAGFTVQIDTVTLAKDGWIVIAEDVDGEPLYLLGASRRDAGTYENVGVELLRNTEEGNTYYAVIYTDDGDKEFDNKKDMPLMTGDGNPVMDAFEIVRR